MIAEWINVEYLGNIHYDSPVLRFGKAFTTLGVALGLAAFFQVRHRPSYYWSTAHSQVILVAVYTSESGAEDAAQANGGLQFLVTQLCDPLAGVCPGR